MNLDKAELTVEQAVNDAGGTVVVKPTKTRQTRTVGLDAATVAFLREHIETMDKRAAELGETVGADAYVFSLEPDWARPM